MRDFAKFRSPSFRRVVTRGAEMYGLIWKIASRYLTSYFTIVVLGYYGAARVQIFASKVKVLCVCRMTDLSYLASRRP